MPQRNRNQRLTGQFPLSYVGVNPTSPSNFIIDNRAPTPTDAQNFFVGDFWLDNSAYPAAPGAENIWVLVSLTAGIATWVNLAGGNALETLTGNVGGPVPGDANDNINTIGDGIGITVVGNPATNTLTWSLVGGGVATQSYLTDDALVEVPNAAGQLTVTGTGVVTVGNVYSNTNTLRGIDVNTVGIALNNSIGQPFTTADGSSGVYSLGVTDLVTDRFMHAYGTGNTFLGRQSGNLTLTPANAVNNTCVGINTGRSLVGGAAAQGAINTFVGANAGLAATNGSGNVFLGVLSGTAVTTSDGNCFTGGSSGLNLVTGAFNTFNGTLAGSTYTTTESGNVIMGAGNTGRLGENNTIRIGATGAAVATTDNIFIGRDSATSAYNVAVATNNIFIGANNSTALTTGAGNVSMSGGSLAIVTSGSRNCAIGAGSGNAITTGTDNVFYGNLAGSAYTLADTGNICIGSGIVGKAGESGIIRIGNTAAAHDIFIGSPSGNTTYTFGTAVFNIGLGNLTLNTITTGRANIAIGQGVGQFITTGSGNIGMGYTALNAVTTGLGNVCHGSACGAAITTGSLNTGFGDNALAGLQTGSNNTALGGGAGSAYAGAESDNITIGSGVIGTLGESSVLRIGLATNAVPGAGVLSQAFICGIRGITTAVNDAVAVLVDSANQLGTVSSTREVKDNINDMGSYSDVLYSMRPVVFNYKQHPSDVISVGLIAEEVEGVMPRLVAYQDNKPMSVKYHDLPAMLLNELQKLEKRVSELEQSPKECKCQK